jgi:hypothetical protein
MPKGTVDFAELVKSLQKLRSTERLKEGSQAALDDGTEEGSHAFYLRDDAVLRKLVASFKTRWQPGFGTPARGIGDRMREIMRRSPIYAEEPAEVKDGQARNDAPAKAEGKEDKAHVATTPELVSLILSRATARRGEHDTLFTCEVKLDNATGEEITTRSNFSSVFDGLELIVTAEDGKTEDGKTIARQPYTYHQSPFAPPGRTFVLKRGSTPGSLVFPIRGLAGELKRVKVRLVGTLPGSDDDGPLSSEALTVEIGGTLP